MLIRVGSRGSRLALTQAELAANAIRAPGVEIALVPITTQIVNKLLHLPIVRLKQAAAAEGSGYVEVARDLFGLPGDESVDQSRKPRK